MAMLNNQRVNWSGSPPVDSVDGAAKDRTLLASLLDQWDLRRRIGPRLFRNSLKNPSFLRYSSNGSAVQNVQNTPSKSSKSSKIHVFDLFLQLGTSSEADFTWEFGGYAPSPNRWNNLIWYDLIWCDMWKVKFNGYTHHVGIEAVPVFCCQ